MKMGDIRCRLCKRNALESTSYLVKVEGEWQCARPCEGQEMTNEEKVLDAIKE